MNEASCQRRPALTALRTKRNQRRPARFTGPPWLAGPPAAPTFPAAPGWLIPGSTTPTPGAPAPARGTPTFPAAPGWLTPGSTTPTPGAPTPTPGDATGRATQPLGTPAALQYTTALADGTANAKPNNAKVINRVIMFSTLIWLHEMVPGRALLPFELYIEGTEADGGSLGWPLPRIADRPITASVRRCAEDAKRVPDRSGWASVSARWSRKS